MRDSRATFLSLASVAAVVFVYTRWTLSALLARQIASMLHGVRPLDPLTFVVVTLVITVMAALAVAGPAWRAAQVDPAAALRVR